MARLHPGTLLCQWLGEGDEAYRLESAIATVIRERRIGTYDVGLSNTTLEVAEEIARRM